MADVPAVGTEQLLPFERADSPADTRKSLFAALDSELKAEETEGEDESAAEEDDESESAGSEEETSEEEEESEDESDEEEEAEGEEEEEPDAETVFEVQGEKVTLQGLKDGWLRQADYTRKTQALADDRRKAEAEATELRGRRDQYAERLEALGLALKQATPQEQDWDKLEREDPAKFNVEWARYQRHKAKLEAVEAEQRKVYEERVQDFERQRERYLAEQKDLLHAAIPDWKDEAKSKAERGKLADYLRTSYGWTDDDLATVGDHRMMVIFRKAMLYDEGQKNGKRKIAGKIKPATQGLKPGARERSPRRGQKIAARKARQQLARSGRTEDAARFLETLID